MIYITYERMLADIRNNITKIPKDICGVVGVPRSGMLPATIIAEYLNVGLTTLDNAIVVGVESALSSHGGRKIRNTHRRKLLVVDDTCYWGNAMTNVLQKLQHNSFAGYEIIYLVVYLEGPCTKAKPDIWLCDIHEEAIQGPCGWAVYEWNLFAHGRLTDKTLFDMDGVIVCEPPDERKTEEYERYIANPTPLYVPTGNVINICTYRLDRYRSITESSLRDIGINCNMMMAKDRNMPAWEFKARLYSDRQWLLFVESSDFQAQKIYAITNKPVISIEKNKVYG